MRQEIGADVERKNREKDSFKPILAYIPIVGYNRMVTRLNASIPPKNANKGYPR